MKALVLILALSFAAAAQTMVGLPQYDVTLSGDAENPVVTNHSGKRIIGVEMRFELANGAGDTGGVTQFMDWVGFAPGESRAFPGTYLEGAPQSTTKVIPGGLHPSPFRIPVKEPVVRVSLKMVVFEDCEFVGPDTSLTSEAFAKSIKDFRAMGQSVIDGSRTWADVATLSKKERHEDSLRMRLRFTAAELNRERITSGEARALELARRYSELPDLWKGETK